MGTLLDTSVLIRVERTGFDLGIPADEEVGIAAITASELLHGVHRAATSEQRAKREAFVTVVLSAFPIVPFDEAVARVHARIWAELAAVGNAPGAHDLIIAATALALGWKLATYDTEDFARVPGLDLFPLSQSR